MRAACRANLVRASPAPAQCSKRLLLFPTDIKSPLPAFDFGAASVTGVDIDPKLVAQAEALLALRSSRVRPATTTHEQLTPEQYEVLRNHGAYSSDILIDIAYGLLDPRIRH